ncbi:MAG: flap endonuclease-1 [Candidatus Methanomethylicus sp.]|nr:flap endonuclease-1 [Candidatus Methanomethylicus sp.]
MGVNLRDLVTTIPAPLDLIRGRVVAIDGYNALYQFLAIIRQPDGSSLMDSQGRITSHLSGVFYRTINLLEGGVKPAYVFDGKPPELKTNEIERRAKVKEKARADYAEALEKGDLVEAKKQAQATSKLSVSMVQQAKDLLGAMGVPWVQAPSEGEAQAAFMARKGDAWATVSQDYDALLFGSPRLIRNLTISGRRKLPNKPVYMNIEPEMLKLEDTLAQLMMTREQLIDLGILLGTDFNPDGFKGIGPKKAFKIITEAQSLENAIARHLIEPEGEFDYVAIRDIFLNPKTTDDYHLEWRAIEKDVVMRILCDEHDFSYDRVEAALARIEKTSSEMKKQPNLEKWF